MNFFFFWTILKVLWDLSSHPGVEAVPMAVKVRGWEWGGVEGGVHSRKVPQCPAWLQLGTFFAPLFEVSPPDEDTVPRGQTVNAFGQLSLGLTRSQGAVQSSRGRQTLRLPLCIWVGAWA